MARAAVIVNGKVENVIEIDPAQQPPVVVGYIVILPPGANTGPGDTFDGEAFTHLEQVADSNASSVTDVDTNTTDATEDDDTDDTIGETTTK